MSSSAVTAAACSASLDDVFGPQVDPCRRAFDFTLEFEASILTTLPLTIWMLLVPLRIMSLLKSTVKVQRSNLYTLKMACYFFHPYIRVTS